MNQDGDAVAQTGRLERDVEGIGGRTWSVSWVSSMGSIQRFAGTTFGFR